MRVLVVGLGIQGSKRLRAAQGDVVATVDPYSKSATYTSLEKVPLESFDAALVCTPDVEKFGLIKYLLGNKKHVLVEKPLVFSISEFDSLEALAKNNKVTCYTAYNHRFEPHFVRLHDVIKRRVLGEIYLLRLFYGNGTARDVRNSDWKDKGDGVISDLGSHLLDTVLYWFGKRDYSVRMLNSSCFENQSCDYAHFSLNASGLTIECAATYLSWKNTFRADVYGELGSAHIDCLCKWGPSTFSLRKRVFPSGRPEESVETLTCADPTWDIEYEYFKKCCLSGESNLKNDREISNILSQLCKI